MEISLIYILFNTQQVQEGSHIRFRISQHQDHGLDQLHTKAIVNSAGRIQWMSPSVKRLSCHVDMTFFPYDTQVRLSASLFVSLGDRMVVYCCFFFQDMPTCACMTGPQ